MITLDLSTVLLKNPGDIKKTIGKELTIHSGTNVWQGKIINAKKKNGYVSIQIDNAEILEVCVSFPEPFNSFCFGGSSSFRYLVKRRNEHMGMNEKVQFEV